MRIFNLFKLVSVSFISSCCIASAEQSKKANVIIILTDDQGYGDLASTGNDKIKTPFLDDLASQSIRFTNFHVNSVCSPSRAALMSGRYASSVGVWHTLGGREIMQGKDIMPQAFKASGYQTMMIGKWHLGDNFPYRPEDRGFDKVYRIGGGAPGQIADYWGNGLFNTNYWNGEEWVKSKGFCTDTQFDAAIDFVEQNKEEPFFLFLSTTAAHSPVGAPQEYLDLYKGLDKKRQTFYGMLSNLDANVGRLRNRLKQLKIEDDTIVIFLTDNGSACDKKNQVNAFNAGMRGKKGSIYEGGHRVPCFLHVPNTNPQQSDVLAAHIDLYPTLQELCGLKPLGVKFDGCSLMPVLEKGEQHWPDRILLTESKVNKRDNPFDSAAVMKGSWRLINGKELYDLQQDPSQKNDVSSKNPAVAKELRDYYQEWYDEVKQSFSQVARIGVGFPQHNPAVLTCMELFPVEGKEKTKTVWNQKGVRNAERNLGVWKLDVAESGHYSVTLHRWAPETGFRFDHTPEKSEAVRYEKAVVYFGQERQEKSVDNGSKGVTFEARLQQGPLEFQGLLWDDKGQSTSAYYVTFKKMK